MCFPWCSGQRCVFVVSSPWLVLVGQHVAFNAWYMFKHSITYFRLLHHYIMYYMHCVNLYICIYIYIFIMYIVSRSVS